MLPKGCGMLCLGRSINLMQLNILLMIDVLKFNKRPMDITKSMQRNYQDKKCIVCNIKPANRSVAGKLPGQFCEYVNFHLNDIKLSH